MIRLKKQSKANSKANLLSGGSIPMLPSGVLGLGAPPFWDKDILGSVCLLLRPVPLRAKKETIAASELKLRSSICQN